MALFTRREPEWVSYGLSKGPDGTGRVCCMPWWNGISIVNTYIPQGFRIDHPKYRYKLDWFKRLRRYFIRHLSPDNPAIWCGDMNVAPEPVDVHHPEKHIHPRSVFIMRPGAPTGTLSSGGFEDLFPASLPRTGNSLRFGDYRQPDALKANRGWRVDHILATGSLARRCTAVEVDIRPRKEKLRRTITCSGWNFPCRNVAVRLNQGRRRSGFYVRLLAGSAVSSWCGECSQVE